MGPVADAKARSGDEFADFRGATRDGLLAFQRRRLEALEHVAHAFPGDPDAEKTPFVLPDLAGYVDKAGRWPTPSRSSSPSSGTSPWPTGGGHGTPRPNAGC